MTLLKARIGEVKRISLVGHQKALAYSGILKAVSSTIFIKGAARASYQSIKLPPSYNRIKLNAKSEIITSEGSVDIVKKDAWVNPRVVPAPNLKALLSFKLGIGLPDFETKAFTPSMIKYGRLYTWKVADNSKVLIDGMTVPTDAQWTTLENYIDTNHNQAPDDFGVGNHLKHRRQVNSPLGGAWAATLHPRWDEDGTEYGRDTVGFGGLSGGGRWILGFFSGLGTSGRWWSSTESSSTHAWCRILSYNHGDAIRDTNPKPVGLSIRLVRDATLAEQEFEDGIIIEQVEDYDKNVYDCVKIGEQVWTVQNLATTRYLNGDVIPHVEANWGGLTATDEAYCDYDNDISNSFYIPSLIKYGYHYSWYVTQEDLITDFHCPTKTEWDALITYIDTNYNVGRGEFGVGNHLKHRRQVLSFLGAAWATLHQPRWNSHDIHYGRDSVLFGLLPGGERVFNMSMMMGISGQWWSSSEHHIVTVEGVFYNALAVQGTLSESREAKDTGRSIKLMRAATVTEQDAPDGTIVEVTEDYDGNKYDCVKIGDQVWTVQNLATTHLLDGTAIPKETGDWDSSAETLMYLAYHNDETLAFYDNEDDSIWRLYR